MVNLNSHRRRPLQGMRMPLPRSALSVKCILVEILFEWILRHGQGLIEVGFWMLGLATKIEFGTHLGAWQTTIQDNAAC